MKCDLNALRSAHKKRPRDSLREQLFATRVNTVEENPVGEDRTSAYRLFLRRVEAASSEDFVVLVGGVDFDFRKPPSLSFRRGSSSRSGIGCGALRKSGRRLVRAFSRKRLDGAAARFVGKLFRDVGAPTVAGRDEQYVHDGSDFCAASMASRDGPYCLRLGRR